MPANEKSDLDRIGLFKEMEYLHGVEYHEFRTDFNQASHAGKQMMTNGSKAKCGTQDGYFEKEFARIFEGEGYNDPIRMRRTYFLEQAKKNRGIFKPLSPTKLPSGVGSYYGTFYGHGEQPLEYFSGAQVEGEQLPPPKRNFFTNPPKKGTGYGYPNITISKMPPYFLEGEYEKLQGQEREGGERPAGEPEKVFILGMHEKVYFDCNPFFTDTPLPIWREIEKPPRLEIPFIPPSPAKKDGGMKAGCLDKFPEYMSSPFVQKWEPGRGDKRVVNSSGKLFVPVPGVRVYPVRSIIQTNVQKSLNANNCRTTKGIVYCRNS